MINQDIFYRGLAVSLNIKGKPYHGVIVNMDVGKRLVVKVHKADMNLMNVMLRTEVTVRFISDDGKAYGFKSAIRERKVPLLTLSFPEEKLQGVSVRKAERVKTSFWTSLKLNTIDSSGPEVVAKSEMIGDGNIVDLGMGGCRLMSQQKLKRGSSVLLEFQFGERDEEIEVNGIVRGSRPAPYESIYYGMEFKNLADDIKKKIEKIMENPET